MCHTIHYALHIDQSTGAAPTTLLAALEEVMAANWQAVQYSHMKPEDLWYPTDQQHHWSMVGFISGIAPVFRNDNEWVQLEEEALSNPGRITFLNFAQVRGLDLYAEAKLSQQLSVNTLT